MHFFMQRNAKQPVLEGNGVLLRGPHSDDFAQWKHLREQSSAFLTPFEPLWPADDLTWAGYRRRLERYTRDCAAATSHTWFIFGNGGRELQGGLTLSAIRLGTARSCQLGYWMGEPHAGKGIMPQAVKLALLQAFDRLGLERVEAACLPQNQRSIRLLEKTGFVGEGMARAYLEINGVRADHLFFAILRSDFAATSPQGVSQGLNIAGIDR